jgi:excisionase family DNA binding protein
MNDLEGRRLMNIEQAARYTGTTPGSIRVKISKGALPFPYSKDGRKLVFDRRDLDRWIDALPRFGDET